MKHPIIQTRNGAVVYVDLIHSPAAARIATQPRLLGLLKEVLGQSTVNTAEVCIEQDMGRDIGYNLVAETSDSDVIFYAQLPHDDTYTRFIKTSKPISTQYLTIMLQRDDKDAYELRDAWIGRATPPRPGSTTETAKSKPFWATHAYIFDGQPLQLRTVTKVCPY